MKRKPKMGEPFLAHLTTETGDLQTFAIHQDNYDPTLLASIRQMDTTPLMGYSLEIDHHEDGAHVGFFVCREDGTRLTRNLAEIIGNAGVYLSTTILHYQMSQDESALMADLEQCAALALLHIHVPNERAI